jgi:ATP-dependent Clp protease adapter protein ClpS
MALSPALTAILQETYREVDERAMWVVTPEVLLLCIVRSDEGKQILGACGADVVEMAGELVDYLELLERKPKRGIMIDAAVEHTVQRAAIAMQAAGKKSVGVGAVLARFFALTDAYATMLLGAAGIERVDLLRYLSHGTTNVKPVDPGESRWLRVRLFNDDYTTMEVVVDVLTQIFHLSADKAAKVMMEIHQGESAIVATLDHDDAVERIVHAYELVTQRGYPLRMVLEIAE